ncbi:hypothetical protein [Paracidovorax cattleyae]|uniref:hypothetical protein n=1 Tax=Paracidovorax cattleyae TaxID=80868 RepID=UPI0018AFBE59|nr:hypothetical protein [Paracidovorax cattleyae]MBF9263627.1 hypothetical protein [Paracidovorax cattleyae]
MDVDDVNEDDFDASEGALKFLGAIEMVIDFVLKGGRKMQSLGHSIFGAYRLLYDEL